MARKRLNTIDMATGLAIFLVVLGHVVARQPPEGNDWYVELKYLIYKFHMPFFMFLSGTVFYYTYKPINTAADYWRYVTKKGLRLLPGFLVFSMVIWLGKILASHFLQVDNLPSDGLKSLMQIFFEPASSVAGSLWYIYVLFEFYLLFPVFVELFRRNVAAIVCLAAILHFSVLAADVTDFLAIDRFCEYSLFFAIGIVFVSRYESSVIWFKRRAILLIGLFLLSFVSIGFIPEYASKTLIGLLSIPALYSLVDAIRSERVKRWLALLGTYTVSIYLMNTLFIGLTKGVMLKFASWDNAGFLIFFPALLVAGIVGPILAQKYCLARIPYLRHIAR